jgi:hypothetical protein
MHKANDKALAFCMGSHGRLGEKSPMTRLDANLLRMIMARTYLCSDFDEGRIIDDDETDAVRQDTLGRSWDDSRFLCVSAHFLRIDRLCSFFEAGHDCIYGFSGETSRCDS